MPYFEHQKAEIFYETWGEGVQAKGARWITLLNGASRTSSDFRAMARFFVENNWNVLTLDNRGAGQTKSPLGFSLNDSAEDVEHLWDHLGIRSSCLLGISYGGVLAQHIALNVATRIEKLILVSTAARASDIHSTSDILKYFSKSFTDAHQIMVRAFSKEMGKAFEDPDRANLAQAQRKAMEGFDLSNQLMRITNPTLVLHGSEDAIVPLSAGKFLQAKIPNAKIEIFEGVGHLLLAETPKRLYDTVLNFCLLSD